MRKYNPKIAECQNEDNPQTNCITSHITVQFSKMELIGHDQNTLAKSYPHLGILSIRKLTPQEIQIEEKLKHKKDHKRKLQKLARIDQETRTLHINNTSLSITDPEIRLVKLMMLYIQEQFINHKVDWGTICARFAFDHKTDSLLDPYEQVLNIHGNKIKLTTSELRILKLTCHSLKENYDGNKKSWSKIQNNLLIPKSQPDNSGNNNFPDIRSLLDYATLNGLEIWRSARHDTQLPDEARGIVSYITELPLNVQVDVLHALLRSATELFISNGRSIRDKILKLYEIDPTTHEFINNSSRVKLTQKEEVILQHLITNRRRIISIRELEDHFEDKSNTVSVYVRRIRKKIGVEFIKTIHGHGYYFQSPDI